jgi:hypothetical protein
VEERFRQLMALQRLAAELERAGREAVTLAELIAIQERKRRP